MLADSPIMKTKLRVLAVAGIMGALPLFAACSASEVNPPPMEDDAPAASQRVRETVDKFSFQGCAHEYTVTLPKGWKGYDETYVPANTGINGGGISDDNGNSVVLGCYTQAGLTLDVLKQDASTDILATPQISTPGTITAESPASLGALEGYEYAVAHELNVTQKVRVTVIDPSTDQALALIVSGTARTPEAQEQINTIIDSIEIL